MAEVGDRGRRPALLLGVLVAAGAAFSALLIALTPEKEPTFPGGIRIPAETGAGASWSPNGRLIAIPNRDGVLLRRADGGRRQLEAPSMPRYLGVQPGRIGWAPRGGELRYLTNDGPGKPSGAWLTIVPADGEDVEQRALGTSALAFDLSPTGWPLAYVTGPYAFGPNGDVGPKARIWKLANATAEPRILVDLPGKESALEYSPDGERLLFAREEREPAVSLWVVASNGSRPRRLAGPFIAPAFTWSPDGRRVAIAATAFGGDRRRHLYVVPADGGPLRTLASEEVGDAEPAWTPDGRWITYATYGGTIRSVRLDRGKRKTIAEFDRKHVRNLIWSPDGEHLAYSLEDIREPQFGD